MNSRGFQKQATKVSFVVILLCGMALNSGLSSTAHAQVGSVTTRVSVASDGTEGDNRSDLAVISGDGRYVAFSSLATNLVLGDANGVRDVFLFDNETKVTTRVSVDSNGVEENATSSPLAPSISADGRYIVYSSLASNLVLGDTNGVSDVFLHDILTSETKLVSVNSDGIQGDDSSGYSSISADGRYVAFSSYAGNLVAGGGSRRLQVYRHDMLTGANVLISVDFLNGGQGADLSFSRAISADGRYIAFSSYASNLVSGDTNLAMDAFVHDTQTGITTRVSVDSNGIQANSTSDDIMRISGNGRYVMFGSLASNLVLNDTNEVNDVFLHDMQTGTTTRVSVDSNGIQGNSHSYTSSISSDGRYVTFSSSASNLVSGDTQNQYSDTFVHDIQTGETKLISLNSDCMQGNGDSGYSSISADGRYVTFESFANNLVLGDTNGTSDIFVRDRLGCQVSPPGIDYHTRDGFHVFKIDMLSPNISFEMVMASDVTSVNSGLPLSSQRESVSHMVTRAPYVSRNPVLALNADYFGDTNAIHGPEGLTVKNGSRFDGKFAYPPKEDKDGNEYKRSSLSISASGIVRIGKLEACKDKECYRWLPTSAYYNTVGGGPLFIADGERIGGVTSVQPCLDEKAGGIPKWYCNTSFKWTAAGITQDGRYLIVVVSDVDKSMDEAAAVLIAEGAWRAIKLDGGGSTQVWYKFANPQSIINGGRRVANALMVFSTP